MINRSEKAAVVNVLTWQKKPTGQIVRSTQSSGDNFDLHIWLLNASSISTFGSFYLAFSGIAAEPPKALTAVVTFIVEALEIPILLKIPRLLCRRYMNL